MRARRDMSFHEWQQEQRRLGKAPASGGARSPLSPISPGAGQFGPYSPQTTPPGRPPYGGNIGLPAPQGAAESKYRDARPDQPPPWIDDVDMEENWYSPFQPIWPFGPPKNVVPREWDYPVGYNLNYIQPRIELMSILRSMRNSWGFLSTVIATRQDQLLRIPWTIQRRDKPRASSRTVEEIRKFFRHPDGKLSYSQWTRKLTDDLLVLDAPTIYFARNRSGKPLAAEVFDGATIFPLIDDAGRRPDTIVDVNDDGMTYLRRQPAFQQIIKGLPMLDLDESEIMYVPMRPRPEMPMFGYPPTEQILVEATEGIRKTFYRVNFWKDGTIPDLIVTVPDQWSPRHIAMFQAHFDALLSGNIELKSKVRFVPGGMKPFEIKNADGQSHESARDEALVRLVCYAYSVSPAPFVRMLNRSTAQNAQQMAEEEGLFPLMSFWKDDIIDPIIQQRFGYEDVEFVFQPRPEPDQEKAAKIHDMKIKNGEMSRNEAREEDGLEPIPGGDVYTIQVGNAVIPLEMAAAGHALPILGGSGQAPSTSGDGVNSGRRSLRPEASPQRGPVRPSTSSPLPQPTPVRKASKAEVRAAAQEATGGIDNYSHLVLHTGNYKKGHVWIQGLNISIENRKGSKRGEKDQHGKKWQVKMPAPYGYIRGTIGADGMQMDVYIGKNPNSPRVWVIDQDKVTPEGAFHGFDEHKVMLGYKKLKPALRDWLKSHFEDNGHEKLANVVELSIDEFKAWLKDGDLKRPISEQGVGTIVLTRADLKKNLDTISSATGLAWYDQGQAEPAKSRKRKPKRRTHHAGPRWLELHAF